MRTNVLERKLKGRGRVVLIMRPLSRVADNQTTFPRDHVCLVNRTVLAENEVIRKPEKSGGCLRFKPQ